MNLSQIISEIESSWKEVLLDEFQKKYFLDLQAFLEKERNSGKEIYPPESMIFNAFNTTSFDKVKVVILGQDPYYGEGQAHGLSFSVLDGIKPPPSLANIYKELHNDIGCTISVNGNLTKWAKQGVLLLNAMLTVEARQPASHQKKGWEEFTDAVIQQISDKKIGVIFILWGKYAQEKGKLIDRNKHFVLQSAHPSPFSATKFYGSKHFSQVNQILQNQGQSIIDWQL